MYLPGQYFSPTLTPLSNLDLNSYFQNLEYLIARPHRFYRSVAYTSLFPQSLDEVFIGGLEKYITRIATKMQVDKEYSTTRKLEYSLERYTSSPIIGLQHDPIVFLAPNRRETEIVEELSPRLRKAVNRTFRFVTGEELPSNILISVLDTPDFLKTHMRHTKMWANGTVGFAINRAMLGDFSQVFVLQGSLDSVMLTLGHEIGHCMTHPLDDPIMEEAKAFAFELAWMDAIRTFDVLHLGDSIRLPSPAENNFHNKALEIVLERMKSRTAIQVFRDIADPA